jgi:hypothetical protein
MHRLSCIISPYEAVLRKKVTVGVLNASQKFSGVHLPQTLKISAHFYGQAISLSANEKTALVTSAITVDFLQENPRKKSIPLGFRPVTDWKLLKTFFSIHPALKSFVQKHMKSPNEVTTAVYVDQLKESGCPGRLMTSFPAFDVIKRSQLPLRDERYEKSVNLYHN